MTATIHALPTAHRVEIDPRADAERAYQDSIDAYWRWPATETLAAYLAAYRDYLTLCRMVPWHVADRLAKADAAKMRHAAVLEGCYYGDPEGDL